MKLKLERPLIFFDTETTGTDVAKDRIIQIGTIKINPDLTTDPRLLNINPTIPIPAGATEVHGISDAMVADCPTFARVGRGIYNYFRGCDIAGYNSNSYDIPLLAEEFARIEIDFPDAGTRFIDVCNIFKKKEERTLTAAVKFYLKQSHDDAHDARADTEATIKVFTQQLEHYRDLGEMSFDEICEFSSMRDKDLIPVDIGGKICKNKEGQYIYNFGKNKGKQIQEDYYYAEKFMLGPTSDFPETTKRALRRVIAELKGTTNRMF